MYRTIYKPSGQRRSPPHLSVHQPAAPPTQAISPRFAIHLLPPWIWNQLSDINALEQFPRHIARGRRTEEIGDRQSNHTRYPENHGIHLDALISGNHHLVVYLFDRYGSFRRIQRGLWAG